MNKIEDNQVLNAFMIFEKKEVNGAYTLDKAKELISGM